ncbi:MAG: M15 family peptidase [Deltaproteobacteria bacterium]|nr:M15 family peptidase [Deltaproteobacteria bacterium]
MSRYGKSSLAKIATVDKRLVEVCMAVIPVYDHTVVWGARGQIAQDQAYETGASTKKWPNSKHNVAFPELSKAIDIAPWFRARPHIRWNCEEEFIHLAGHMQQAAAMLGIAIRWGGDWDRDHDLHDVNKPFDLGHFELM